MTVQDILNLVLLLIPIFLIQLGIVIYALVDLSRRQQIQGNRLAWQIGLILGGLSVPAGLLVAGAYLAWGRHGGENHDPY